MMKNNYRITLLFNANKAYDRQIIKGIGEYLQATQCDWDIFFEEDFCTNLENIHDWIGDGIIADLDNPEIESLLSHLSIPVIGIGGSYENEKNYPDVPYIATDNVNLVNTAFHHLKDKGLEHFAFYGLPEDNKTRWASEREKAFNHIVNREGYYSSVYRGHRTAPQTWQYDMNRLADWLQSLPTPIGIIAVTDARARHLLQLCDHLNLMVPDQIAIIGIDNEELTRYLTRVSLSSVGQACKSMGYSAAQLLHKHLVELESPDVNEAGQTKDVKYPRILVPAVEVFERQSSDFQAIKDPYVIKAMHYIRNNAYNGIKVDQVLDSLRISRSNLEIRFKEERGHSVHQEIHNSKLKRACELLASTDISIADVPVLCGYPSLQYMYTVFKKDIGITPKDYRIKHVSYSI
ncbi:DNA-binding transcriptional regulator [Psychromonas sp. SA13A]|uniref:XylR family transcriptional regulator n=1 Tax=Psychromonas sp. SA13A TaxID=2686346 RepID=UPI0023F7B71C|nr:DNA-binding transcriptional regulator [Psychromonas sp. SA13A]